MKTCNKLIALCICAVIAIAFNNLSAQTFEQDLPENYTSIGFQVDPHGSYDKEGLNSVINISVVEFGGHFEFELMSQTIINVEKPKDKTRFTYIDVYLGGGYLFPLSPRVTYTLGGHWGIILRPENITVHPDNESWQSSFSIGTTMKGRIWLGKTKKLAIVMSGALDTAPDVKDKDFRIQGRGGLEWRL